MKVKRLFYLFSSIVLTVSVFSGNVFAYYNGTTPYYEEPKTAIGSFKYILKENVQYGSVKVPYSATVVDIPNVQKVEIPEKVIYNGTEFTVTDLDLCESYIVTKENNVKTIVTHTDIKEITLPNTIYNITSFENFPNLLKINIPLNAAIGRNDNFNKVKYDDYDTAKSSTFDFQSSNYESWFTGCPKLKLSVDPNNKYYNYKNDLLYSKDGKEIYMSFNYNSDIIIPYGVEKIYRFGGNGFHNAKNINLPNTLTYLGDSVFAFSEITKINLPNSLKVIEQSAFKGSKLKKIILPKKIKKIKQGTFRCTNLNSIKLDENLTAIQRYSFSSCKKLKAIIIPKKVKNIGDSAFMRCKNLSKVNIKTTKKSPKIGKNAFRNTKKGIRFVVKNKKVAKSLNKKLKNSGVKKANILVGKKVVYHNING